MSGLQAGSVDLPRLVYAVLHSPEARAQRGVYGSANSEQDFTTAIKLTYESMLGRTASDEDVGLWWSALLQNLQSVSGIIVQISTSDEALQWRRRRDASSPAGGATRWNAFGICSARPHGAGGAGPHPGGRPPAGVRRCGYAG